MGFKLIKYLSVLLQNVECRVSDRRVVTLRFDFPAFQCVVLS